MIDIHEIERANERIRGGVYRSPCVRSESLSRRTGCDLYVKLENLQMTGSFKERGALNKVLQLSEGERARGVITASAGNHAQGVAFVAERTGIRATIVMPVGAPLVKVTATRGYGAEVISVGEDYDAAQAAALRIAEERGLTFVHAFDDDAVIAGQGTIGLELLEQLPDVDAVIVPVGGGGLAAGVGTVLAARRPDAALYGVEARAVPSMRVALDAGAPMIVPPARTLADGVAVRRVAARTLEVARRVLTDVVVVDEEEIAEAVLVLLELEKTLAEGAAAATLAAALQRRVPVAGKRVVLVISGGNIDVNLLARIIDRGLAKSGRSMRIKVLIPDLPGSLAALLGTVARTQANVLEVHHDRLASRAAVGRTQVELVLETRGFDHIGEIERSIKAEGWELDG
jgi:threonine dehydratase